MSRTRSRRLRWWPGAAFALSALAGWPQLASAESHPHTVTVEARHGGAAANPVAQRGLGFVVESDGFVLTTRRNLVDPKTDRLLDDVRVRPWDRLEAKWLPARIIGVEPTLDLGVLKIDAPEPLRASSVRHERGLEVGQEVLAPTRLDPAEPAYARGHLSGLNSKECYQEGLTATLLRAELALPTSAEGAPVYATDGEIVALYTAHQPEARAHVDALDEVHLLPIYLAFNIYDSIKQKRSLRSPWTGFSVRSLEPAEQAIFPTPRGDLGGIGIEFVWEGGPAEAMGIEVGDILVQMGHNRIFSVGEFQKWLYLYGVGESIELVIIRDGSEYLAVDYLIEERPDWARPR